MKFLQLTAAAATIGLLAACEQAPSGGAGAPTASAPAAAASPTSAPANVAPAGGIAVVPIGNVSVPLPEGDWTLAGTADVTPRRANGQIRRNYPTAAHVFVSETGSAIDRVVVVWEQRARGSGYFLDFDNCELSSNLASDVRSKAANSTDCVYVRSLGWPDGGDISRILRRYAASKGLFAPAVTVGPRVALSLSSRQRVAIDYAFNVDLMAPHPTGGVWTPGDWTRASTSSGAKAAVVDAMLAFGRKMRPEVARANAGTS